MAKQNKILKFSHSDKLIFIDDEPLRNYEVVDPTGNRFTVEAYIQDESVIIPNDGLQAPFIVRYGYDVYPIGKLYNSAGLPASPFISDIIQY